MPEAGSRQRTPSDAQLSRLLAMRIIAYKTEWFKVPRGGGVILYGRTWTAWPWSCWAKVRVPIYGRSTYDQ
jgi:hypothetical protein